MDDATIAGNPRNAALTFLTCVDGLSRHPTLRLMYADLASIAGIAEPDRAIETFLGAKLIVWAEGRGWTVTGAGRELITDHQTDGK